MEQNLVYAKTPLGEEAVRQSTRVVQRNLRMVLVQVDGKLTVGELATKIGNVRLVETALKELADGGYIAPGHEALAAWEEGKKTNRRSQSGVSALSQLSEFGPRSVLANESKPEGASQASSFSTFGKPIPAVSHGGNERDISDWGNERPEPPEKHRQIPTRGILRGLLLVLVVTIFGLALFPYDRFRPEMESALGNAFQATVKVGDVHLDVFPIPQLVASNIRVGDSGDIAIERMIFASPFGMLTSGASAVREIRVAGVRVFADRLAGISVLRNPGQLKRVMVERMSIVAGPMAVSELGGEISLAVSGGVEKIELQTAEKTLHLVARPSGQSLALTIEGYGWRPISDVAVAFDNMRAKAVLKPGRLLVEDIDSTFMGGALKGNFVLDWNAGINMAGDVNIARIDIRKVAALWAPRLNMEGEIAGNVHLRNAGNNVESFWNSMEATMSAEIARGVVHGLDLGEVARRGAGYAVRSGSTKFDSLRADLTLNPSQFIARNIQMDAGMLTASGQLIVQRNLETDGSLVVNMRSSVSSLRVPVKVSGTLNGLIATTGK